MPCCQALYRLSPYYQFGNGYLERLNWWLKTHHSGVGTQLSSSRPMLWYTPPLTLREGSMPGGLCSGDEAGSGPMAPPHWSCSPASPDHSPHVPWRACALLLLCLLSHNSRCLSWDSVWFCTVSIVYWYGAGPTSLLGWWWVFRTVPISLDHNISLTSTCSGHEGRYSTLM